MGKEIEALEPSVVLKFIDDLLKRYENKTDYNIYITKDWLLEIKQALQRLEAIDNANPSEALLGLKHIKKYYIPEPCSAKTYDCLETIKQALLKAQEPKHYLKWEDLEFSNELKALNVKMNNNDYILRYTISIFGCDCCFLYDRAKEN